MEHTVEFNNVSFSYGEKVILDSVDLKIPKGKVIVFMGPSGSGKTTLLKLITGSLQPTSGQVQTMNNDLALVTNQQLYAMRTNIGYLFQNNALFTDLTIAENVAFPLQEYSEAPAEIIDLTVRLKLASVGLLAARNLYPQELSGGMARRAGLARALALDPDLVLFDEPFAGQDPINLGSLVSLIRELNDALDLTSVIVSHEIQASLRLADYIYLLHQSKLIGGTPNEMREHQHEFVREFFSIDRQDKSCESVELSSQEFFADDSNGDR